MDGQLMHPKDAPYGSYAEAYITINGDRYKMIQFKEFNSDLETSIKEVEILGQTNMGHKPAGNNGKWSAKAYYNQSVMRKVALEYQNSGFMPYFDIQTSNWDKTSDIGRQTIILKDCLIDKFNLAKFKAGSDILEEDLSGTFETFEMPEEFNLLQGMT